MILLTGATKRVGSATAIALARSSVPFRALVMDPDRVTFDPDAAEIVVGDPFVDSLDAPLVQNFHLAFLSAFILGVLAQWVWLTRTRG